MLTIFFRTLMIYLILYAVMRIMGKRQIGELETTDLVTTLLLSEIASLPITNQELPITYAIIPMVTLLFLEIASSVILIRFPKLRFLVSARPTVIIREGVLDQHALENLRISLDELMSEVRQQGFTTLSQVECAILEKNGKLTILPKAGSAPPTADQLGLHPDRDDLMHIVYQNGTVNRTGLSLIGKDASWLEHEISKRGLDARRLFCITADQSGRIYAIPLQKKKKKQSGKKGARS